MASDDIWKVCELGEKTKSHARTTLSTDEKVIITLPRSDSTTAEFIEVHVLDGRSITIVSASTQTDWEWVEQALTDSCQVQSEVERFEPKASSQTVPQSIVIGPDSEIEETDMEKENELYGIPNVGPPSMLAYKPESKQPPVHFEKIPVLPISGSSEAQSKLKIEFVLCDYCQQPCNPFIRREQLENNRDLELLFCCERAQKMRAFLLEEERALASMEMNRKIDVGPHPPFMNKHEKRAAKERAEQRLLEWELQKVLKKGNQNRFFSGQIKTISYRLSNEVWTFREESHFPKMDIMNSSDIFTLQGETDRQHRERRIHLLLRFYPNGKPFITLYPDGTGNVFYPSGNVAIIISSVEAADFTYIIMEDKDLEPNFEAMFTTRGQSTCYHPNGLIWVNLTQLGGSCCSETGALRRRWTWLDLEPHIQAPPFQPICLVLGSHVSLRIQSQERIYLTFSSHQSRVRFNVGSKLKLTHPEGLVMPGPDILQQHLQMKSLEIYTLLDRMQTCMAYQHSANPHNIKPQYSLVAQMQRLKRQMEKQSSPKNTKALMASKDL
uniref:FAM194 C-terminal domain-containing protein n=2 Tax=Oncorhynchus mykiss TaxID=8022 RepID=A0A8C7W169_ONCMY